MSTPVGANGTPVAPTPWVKMNLADMVKAIGLNGSVIGSEDPTDELNLLRAAAHLTTIGTEHIRGVETTHYHGLVDLERYASFVAPNLRAALRQNAALVKRWTGTSTLPVDAWVDARQRVRRFQLQFSACTHAGRLSEVVSMDIFGYGPQPPVAVPPAGEVTDITGAVLSETSRSLAALAPGCGKSGASYGQPVQPSASPGSSRASAYSREGNAICQSALADQHAVLAPGSPSGVAGYLRRQVQIGDRALRALEALHPPPQERPALHAALAVARRQEAITQQLISRLRAGVRAGALRGMEQQIQGLNGRGNADFR